MDHVDGNLAMNSHFENMSEKDENYMADYYIKTEEGNRIIGAFGEIKYGGYVEYHESWDLLMPVVEQKELLAARNEINANGIQIAGLLASNKDYAIRYEKCLIDFWQVHKQAAGHRDALVELMADIRNKPNDTRYATHMKKAQAILDKYPSPPPK